MAARRRAGLVGLSENQGVRTGQMGTAKPDVDFGIIKIHDPFVVCLVSSHHKLGFAIQAEVTAVFEQMQLGFIFCFLDI